MEVSGDSGAGALLSFEPDVARPTKCCLLVRGRCLRKFFPNHSRTHCTFEHEPSVLVCLFNAFPTLVPFVVYAIAAVAWSVLYAVFGPDKELTRDEDQARDERLYYEMLDEVEGRERRLASPRRSLTTSTPSKSCGRVRVVSKRYHWDWTDYAYRLVCLIMLVGVFILLAQMVIN